VFVFLVFSGDDEVDEEGVFMCERDVCTVWIVGREAVEVQWFGH
jgi:hypothetical protein